MHRILVVDDEVSIRKALEKYLIGLGYETRVASDGEEALQIFQSQRFDLALVDLVMPKVGGVDLIRRLKKIDPDVVAIVLTGFGTITSAVEAMKAGAFHYLTKPFELEDIASLIRTSLDHRKLKEENRLLKSQLRDKYRFESIMGEGEPMQSVFRLMEKVIDTDSTVLLLGESGTGKELIARAIHYNSKRAHCPLMTVNCAAIPEELLESELFGYKKGAFTGAYTDRAGKFEAANGGSMLLDEIGDMSPKLQVKLLRVLQERRFEPVGATESVEVDVRIIAATNQDLEKNMGEGRFREDLYYRLNVIPIRIPPLRERRDDLMLLAKHFLVKYNEANQRNAKGFSAEAMKLLLRYPWPGNVRELENLMERLVILKGEGVIEPKDLPEKFQEEISGTIPSPSIEIPSGGVSFKTAVANFENELILKALEKTGWNKNKAASLLRINRTTLVEKIKKKGLEKYV